MTLNPLFVFIVLLLLCLALSVLNSWLHSPKYKGRKGEERAHKVLEQLPDDYTIIDDVVLVTNSGSTQIDHIVVSKFGVFVIEVKNYRGDIYGNDNREEWTQLIVTDVQYSRSFKNYTYVTKNRFYNPVKQSEAHVYAVNKQLPEWPYLKVVPIVVFVGEAILKEVRSSCHVIYINELLDTILSYKTTYLSNEDVHKVVERLSLRNARETISNNNHVANIVRKNRENKKLISVGICPRCGGKLVKRTGKYGSFYGCSNFPHCKYTAY